MDAAIFEFWLFLSDRHLIVVVSVFYSTFVHTELKLDWPVWGCINSVLSKVKWSSIVYCL